MLANVLILALAASPLVAAHGKVSVVVRYSVQSLSFIIMLTTASRPVTLVETPQLSVFKAASFQELVPTPRPKLTQQSSTNSMPPLMDSVRPKARARTPST